MINYFFDALKNHVTNKTQIIIKIKGMINFLTLSKANNPTRIKTIPKHVQTFSAVSAFTHRPPISQATSLLFSHTFSAVSTTDTLASHIFFSNVAFSAVVFFAVVFFTGILNNIIL